MTPSIGSPATCSNGFIPSIVVSIAARRNGLCINWRCGGGGVCEGECSTFGCLGLILVFFVDVIAGTLPLLELEEGKPSLVTA